MKLTFPNWSMERVLREACSAHNALHPETWVDPVTTSWKQLYPLVMAFLRHELSTYDQSLQTGTSDRNQLRTDISASARKFYRWLRKDKDPRTVQSAPPEEPENFKIFNALSGYGCDLRSQRDQLLMARRKCAPGADRRLLNEDLCEVNRRIDKIDSAFNGDYLDLPLEHKDFRILILAHEGEYFFAGRQLPSSYIKPTDFNCVACHQRVWRTKTPIDLGNAIRMTTFACHCLSFSVTGKYAIGVNAQFWHELVTGEKSLPEEGEN
jgi:hypothetical protein